VAKQRTKATSHPDFNPGPTRETTLATMAETAQSADIATLAYQLWLARGCPEGSPEVDWYEAERKVRQQSGHSAESQVSEPLLMRGSGA
jgi:hypothetical protein